LFHADLHPGNIMLLRNSRFGLIDFGAVGALDGTFREQLNQYNALIAEGSYMKAAEIYLDISSPLPALSSVQIWKLTTAIAHYQRNLSLRMGARTIPHNEKNSAEDSRALARVAARYKVPFSWQWLKLQRTLFALDSSLFALDKNANTIKFGVRYREAAARRQQAKTSAVPIGTRLSDLLTSATAVTGRLDENLAVASSFMRRVALVTEPMNVQVIRYVLKMAAGLALVVGCAIALSAAGSSTLGSVLGEAGRLVTKTPSLRWILWGLAAVGARILYTGVRGIRTMLSK
jgi:ubiquinone biosynthesis protein